MKVGEGPFVSIVIALKAGRPKLEAGAYKLGVRALMVRLDEIIERLKLKVRNEDFIFDSLSLLYSWYVVKSAVRKD